LHFGGAALLFVIVRLENNEYDYDDGAIEADVDADIDADVDADVGKGKGVDDATTSVIITNNLLRSNTKISCGFLDWGCRCTGKESCSEGKENRGASCDQDNCCPFSDDTDCCRERYIWL